LVRLSRIAQIERDEGLLPLAEFQNGD
jgi:hypothetical protein